jgi:hypothetical protein
MKTSNGSTSAPLEEELCRQADALVGGGDAWLIIDNTAIFMARNNVSQSTA